MLSLLVDSYSEFLTSETATLLRLTPIYHVITNVTKVGALFGIAMKRYWHLWRYWHFFGGTGIHNIIIYL
jgi:hypothetical protein